MVIWSYEEYGYSMMNIFYAIFLLIVIAIFIFMIINLIANIQKHTRGKHKIPKKLFVFSGIQLLLTVFIIFSVCNSFWGTMHYEHAMKNGDGIVLQGDVELISYEEEWYRDSFTGYNVVIQVGDVQLELADSLPGDVLDHFRAEEELKITYGVIKGDGLYIWEIETVD